ncbi:MAG: class I SAM-dependent methyltransferase [Armatimonadota bacterium]
MDDETAGGPPETAIYMCARASTYRRLAQQLPRPDDVVVEVGAADGKATRRLAQAARRVIALEKAPAVVEKARAALRRLDNVTLLQADARQLKPVLDLVERADVVFIDISGGAPPAQTLEFGETYRTRLRPRILVLRNTKLNAFAESVTYVEPTT